MTWDELKQYINEANKRNLKYVDYGDSYEVWIMLDDTKLSVDIEKQTGTGPRTEEQADFEDNYMADCNKTIVPPLLDENNKWRVKSDSRPLKPDGKPYETVFSMAGDTENEIGGGTVIYWDFSTDADLIDAPTGYKRKRIEISYIDPIYLKDGTIYYFDVLKGSYIDFYIVCPQGQYYYDNNYQLRVADHDMPVRRFLMHHMLAGTNNLGDELNSESAAENPIPPNYKIWVEITVPAADNSSYGWGELEMYRERSVILP